MKSFYLNIGHQFSRPYESVYSMWRRCLVSNPGISYFVILNNLRQSVPLSISPSERLLRLQLQPKNIKLALPGNVDDSYLRQCPKCAKQLYSTQVFGMLWLTKCPLHHCQLTHYCPTCNQKWPSIEEMSNRSCPTCARRNIKQLSKHITNYQDKDYTKVFSRIYSIVEQEYCYRITVCNKRERSMMNVFYDLGFQKSPSIESLYYPSLQVSLNPLNISSEELSRHYIYNKSIHCKKSHLYWIKKIERKSNYQLFDYPPIEGRDHRKHLRDHYIAMKRIVNWIIKKSGHHCIINISSYRHLILRHFVVAPCFCPYCLALSLWFFSSSTSIYYKHKMESFNDYPFLMQINKTLPSVFIPAVMVLEESDIMNSWKFNLDGQFEKWYFRYTLDLSFIVILKLSISLLSRVKGKNILLSWRDGLEHGHSTDPLLFYECEIQDGYMNYCYLRNHPLGSCIPINDKSVINECNKYHVYLAECADPVWKFNYPITGDSFEYHDYLLLHRRYRSLIKRCLTNDNRPLSDHDIYMRMKPVDLINSSVG